MLKTRLSLLGSIPALVLGIQWACAQGGPGSGLYQIVSGRYIACCGIGGLFLEPLPDASDAFIQLTVDRQNNLAQMKFLDQDMQIAKLGTSPVLPLQGTES